jgi:hypothetical protein
MRPLASAFKVHLFALSAGIRSINGARLRDRIELTGDHVKVSAVREVYLVERLGVAAAGR